VTKYWCHQYAHKNRLSVQFTQSRKNVVNYLQHKAADEGYLVAETVRTGKQQIIVLPPGVNTSALDADDLKIISKKSRESHCQEVGKT
jgi:hypothetical protein